MRQMGVDLLAPDASGKAQVNADKEKVRRLWDNYYIPYVSGYFDAVGKFRSDDVKTGDIICYTGSTASAAYFPDRVVDDNGRMRSAIASSCHPPSRAETPWPLSKEPAWRWRSPMSNTNTLPASS